MARGAAYGALAGGLVLSALSALYGGSRPADGPQDANHFHTVFLGALRGSPTPEADLAERGLPPSMALPTRPKLTASTTWSRSKALLDGAFPALAIGVLAVAVVLPLIGARSRGVHPVPLLPRIAVLAVLQLATVIIGDGTYELAKHLFVFQFLFDGCVIGLWTWALASMARSVSALRS